MKTKKMVPPDGGWGWVVIIGSSFINISTRSFEPSFGLLFGGLFKELGIETTGASVVVATMSTIINLSGLVIGPLIKRFTVRKVAIFGALINTSAFFLTAPAKNITHILITFGIIGGFGFGLATSCTFIAVNAYFSKKKGQAIGLAMAGTGVGFMLLPQLVRYLLDEFNFRTTCLLIGAISLHAVVGAFLFQPVSWHSKRVVQEKDPDTLLATDKDGELDSSAPTDTSDERRGKLNTPNLEERKSLLNVATKTISRKSSLTSSVSLLDEAENTFQIQGITKEESEKELIKVTVTPYKEEPKIKIKSKQPLKRYVKNYLLRICELLDLDLLTDGVFLNIMYSISMLEVAEVNFRMILPFYLSNLGFTPLEVATALSSMAVFDICARLLVPPIIDRVSLSRRNIFVCGLFCLALARSFITLWNTFTPIVATLVVIGLFRGITIPSFPLVLAEYSIAKFPSILGLSMVGRGIFIVVFGPLSGYIRDTTQSYPLFIHFQTLLICLVFIAWIVEIIVLKARNKKKARIDSLQNDIED